MISSLRGTLIRKSTRHIVVDVNGIGYGVSIPLSTFYRLPDEGGTITLAVHTYVREDTISLFGFYTAQEKAIFQRMIAVTGIGPRLALNILSGISTEDLRDAIITEDINRLTTIPGVGRKTAERLLFELRGKLAFDDEDGLRRRPDRGAVVDDALSALVNLGYKESVAKKAVDLIYKECDDQITLERLLTESLKHLSKQ